MDIYNGVDDCTYVYEVVGPRLIQIFREYCIDQNTALSKGSERYGNRLMLGLLDPDILHIAHSGSQLIIHPENFTDQLIFAGL